MSGFTIDRGRVDRAITKAKALFGWDENRFLAQSRGVIHVGANVGQERFDYARHGLAVLWIEPIPAVYEELKRNVSSMDRQHAHQALVVDSVGAEIELNVASNNGASSSIFALAEHREIWPSVDFVRSITVRGTTLDQLVIDGVIDASLHDTLVLDTQGSELLVLKGGRVLLESIRFVKTEAADFNAYDGCCSADEVTTFLESLGFERFFKERFAYKAGVGSYYTLIFRRRSTAPPDRG